MANLYDNIPPEVNNPFTRFKEALEQMKPAEPVQAPNIYDQIDPKINLPEEAEVARQVAAKRLAGGGTHKEGPATGFIETMPHGIPILGAFIPPTSATEKLEKEHPIATEVSKFAGGAAALGPLGATAIGAKLLGLPGTGTVLSRAGLSGVTGSSLSAADAVAHGHDPKLPAVIGGALGVAAPGVGGMFSTSFSKLAEIIGEKTGTSSTGILAGINPLALKLARSMAKSDGLTEQQIEAEFRRLGPQAFVLDYGPNLTGLASGIHADFGPAKTKIADALGPKGRAGQVRDVADAALTDAFEAKAVNIPKYVEFLEKSRKSGSDPIYEQFKKMNVHPTPELQELLPRLKAAGAMDEGLHFVEVEGNPALQTFFVGGPQKEHPTAEMWDYAKKGLDTVIEKSSPGGSSPNPNRMRVYTGLKKDLLNALENHPDPTIAQVYREARQTYAEPTSIMKAVKEGQNWGAYTRDELDQLLGTYSTMERRAFNQGVRSDLDEMLKGTANGPTRIEKFFEAPMNREKLELVVRPPQALANQSAEEIAHIGEDRSNKLVAEMLRQREFSNRKGKIIDNSETAGRQNAKKMMDEIVSGNWMNRMVDRFAYGLHVTPMKYTPGLGTLKGAAEEDATNRLHSMQDAAANILLKQGPEAQAIIRALTQYVAPGEVSGPLAHGAANLTARSVVPQLQNAYEARKKGP